MSDFGFCILTRNVRLRVAEIGSQIEFCNYTHPIQISFYDDINRLILTEWLATLADALSPHFG